jgi:hypothetical protein
MGLAHLGGPVGRLTRVSARRQAPRLQPAEAMLAGLDAAIAVEAAGVTLVGVARRRGADGELELGAEVERFLEAAQCQDEAHYHFLLSIGAVPPEAFALPEGGLGDREGVLRTMIGLEELSIGVHMAAARRFAEEGEPGLVEVAYQMGAVDGGHGAVARALLGVTPANDRAFARWRFAEAAEAGEALAELGFGEDGEGGVAFPGPIERRCAGVFGLVPETTDDALRPRPAVGTPVPR